MRHPVIVLTVMAMALALGGCPPPEYGVSREFDVARLPDPDCIKAAIARVPEITDSQYRPPGNEKDVFGATTGDRGHLVYGTRRQEHGFVEMSFASNSHHPALVTHYSMNRDRHTAREGAAAMHALMLKVEGQLAEHCGMTIVGNVEERLP